MRFETADLLSKAQVRDIMHRYGPLKRYEERYPPQFYKNVITAENQWRVEALDTLTDWMNAYARGEAELTGDGFELLVDITESLIYGSVLHSRMTSSRQ